MCSSHGTTFYLIDHESYLAFHRSDGLRVIPYWRIFFVLLQCVCCAVERERRKRIISLSNEIVSKRKVFVRTSERFARWSS